MLQQKIRTSDRLLKGFVMALVISGAPAVGLTTLFFAHQNGHFESPQEISYARANNAIAANSLLQPLEPSQRGKKLSVETPKTRPVLVSSGLYSSNLSLNTITGSLAVPIVDSSLVNTPSTTLAGSDSVVSDTHVASLENHVSLITDPILVNTAESSATIAEDFVGIPATDTSSPAGTSAEESAICISSCNNAGSTTTASTIVVDTIDTILMPQSSGDNTVLNTYPAYGESNDTNVLCITTTCGNIDAGTIASMLDISPVSGIITTSDSSTPVELNTAANITASLPVSLTDIAVPDIDTSAPVSKMTPEERAKTVRAVPFYNIIARPVARPAAEGSSAVFDPSQIRTAYNVPSGTGGSGTIALIEAYDTPTAEQDLAFFTNFYGMRACTTANGCFEKHKMPGVTSGSGWDLETNLDVQWAHAMAPTAKILVVEATTNLISDFLNAIDYAKSRADVTAISMSWGTNEYPEETTWDSHLVSTRGASFFAATGDGGNGIWWPAISPTVIGVGGTTLTLNGDNTIDTEEGWTGSGGGLSAYESEPSYQLSYNIPSAGGFRGNPDVSYMADPGGWVYNQGGWWQVGGTSLGSPVWAALKTINPRIKLANLYSDAKNNLSAYFNDITTGSNGACGFYCNTASGYDYVTGLGSPRGWKF